MGDDEDYFGPDDEIDEEEQAAMDCGSRGQGRCDLAGTEFCDWDCPLHNQVLRAAIRRAKARAK